MGAAIEIIGAATGQHQLAYTDAKGHFSLNGLLPGSYDLRASAPLFLPTLKEDVSLAAGANKLLNITLNTLFEAMKMLPPPKHSGSEDDDWKWTLRSTANRPILRFDDGSPVIVESSQDRPFRGALAFVAGGASQGYGSGSDLGTAFNLEQSIFGSSVLGFNGSLGYGSGTPDGVLQLSYRRDNIETASSPEMALTVRRFASPETMGRHAALQALAFSYSNGFSLSDLLEVRLGGEMEAIQFMGRANAARPFGQVDLHLTPDMVLEYKYATTVPNTRASKGFDSAPNDLSESSPRVSMNDGNPQIEHAHHHEISLSQRLDDSNMVQIAYFHDRVKDPALLGVGEIYNDGGYLLPDVYSGTFSFNGGELEAQGVRLVYERKVTDSLTATLDYGYGGTLMLDQPGLEWSAVQDNLHHTWRHTAALKLNGNIRRSHTTWIASYRWTSGQALTPVDMFNASAGQTDGFFNVFLRQPIPRWHWVPGHMEALIDLRNLLAQGYVPMISPDGKTVYLVQSARSVRGGVSFTF
jgi:hypothetical protein